MNNYFNIERDKQFSHLCQACLVGKNKVSKDIRYCESCYSILLKEAELDTRRRAADWRPKGSATKQEAASIETAQVSQDVRIIMSTLNGKISEVDIIQPSVAKVTPQKRGPKHKPLPQEMIVQWKADGLGSKAIATRLKTEHGIDVSYKTIQRVLLGERK